MLLSGTSGCAQSGQETGKQQELAPELRCLSPGSSDRYLSATKTWRKSSERKNGEKSGVVRKRNDGLSGKPEKRLARRAQPCFAIAPRCWTWRHGTRLGSAALEGTVGAVAAAGAGRGPPAGQPLAAGEAGYEEWAVTGVQGRAVELSCGRVAAAPPAVVFWSFVAEPEGSGPPRAVAVGSGREVAVAPGAGTLGRVTLRNGTLELRELRAAAQGRFLCQGLFPERGRLHVGYAAVLLRVLVPVSKPFVRPTAAVAAEGATVALTCSVREGTKPLSFSWQHREPRGGPLPSPMGMGGSGAELRLTPANRSHAGWYACTVRNQVNNCTSEPVYLDIIYGPDEPAISVEPFSPEQGGFSAGEREDVVLSCLAPSNPPSRYVWLHNSSQVHTGQTYAISAITRAQAGTYTCLAENTHLQTRTQATTVLTVYYPPPGSPTCSALATGDLRDVALRCRWPGGFPLARLRWVGPWPPVKEDEDEVASGSSLSMATSIQPGAATRNGQALDLFSQLKCATIN
ncbi:V-set and immunoglobulin domain-containing protein 10-like 2 [Phaenicophaeus curvirostris]|uniref:V-set and immunoglobulin domain-containing protein 10-like 2 n=1 Tax=Phaenicophaeus curvirostris TaxID=33595 RepID=UPI0037F0F9E4